MTSKERTPALKHASWRSSSFACLLALLTSPATPAEPAASAQVCRGLSNGTQIGAATVIWSQYVANGQVSLGDKANFRDLPPFCRTTAIVSPSPQSRIVVEVWLPTRSAWNGKFLGTGTGGFGGDVVYPALAGGLRRGYAVANTDLGTYPAGSFGIGYAAGNGRPETVTDWGFRASHELALLGKELVRRFYGQPAKRAYFAGCSTGGHQALSEAQRYPADFDAIIAGAPGHNRTHLHAMFTKRTLDFHSPGYEFPTAASAALWSDARARSCLAKQGGAPGDTFLPNPNACGFKPRQLLCKPGQNAETCLSDGQVRAFEMAMSGTFNPRTGSLIYPGFANVTPGPASMRLPPAQMPIASELTRWVFGPQWDAATFDFDRDMARVDAELGSTINANDADLTRFVARGGKVILFHGWDDLVVSPYDSVLYYDRAYARDARKSDFMRLFMVPGMSHCSGGPGLNAFGQTADMPAGPAEEDLIAALDRWTESGIAPVSVIAKQWSGNQADPLSERKILAARPLCAYPKVAMYKGSGATTEPASYICRSTPPLRYEHPAPEYLK